MSANQQIVREFIETWSTLDVDRITAIMLREVRREIAKHFRPMGANDTELLSFQRRPPIDAEPSALAGVVESSRPDPRTTGWSMGN